MEDPVEESPPSSPEAIMSLNRSLSTVFAVIKEYEEGIDGQPSVKEMNLQRKASWRSSDKDRTLYKRRRVLYECAEKVSIVKQIPTLLAAKELDSHRGIHNKSLDWMYKNKSKVLDWFDIS